MYIVGIDIAKRFQSDALRNMFLCQTKNDTIDALIVAEVIRFGSYSQVAPENIVALRELCRQRFFVVDMASDLKLLTPNLRLLRAWELLLLPSSAAILKSFLPCPNSSLMLDFIPNLVSRANPKPTDISLSVAPLTYDALFGLPLMLPLLKTLPSVFSIRKNAPKVKII